tara:strand:+ start:190 stop:369 length:180 start_codon:yes stop_codon:yes gene_type:complete
MRRIGREASMNRQIYSLVSSREYLMAEAGQMTYCSNGHELPSHFFGSPRLGDGGMRGSF